MKRRILTAVLLMLALGMPAGAEYTVNELPLKEYDIEALYSFEDAVVSALEEAFANSSTISNDGEVMGTYVINPRTKKFHFPYCYSALQIGADRRFETCVPSELVAQGFKPCGQCKPIPGAE